MREGDEIPVFVPNPTYLKHTTLNPKSSGRYFDKDFYKYMLNENVWISPSGAKIDLINTDQALWRHIFPLCRNVLNASHCELSHKIP